MKDVSITKAFVILNV